MMRKIVFWVIYLTLLLAAIVLFQRKIIYLPTTGKIERKDYRAQDMVPVKLTTSDGIKLTAWYKEAKVDQATLLFLHGNAGHIGSRMPWIRGFLDRGVGVLLLSYRGYADSEGSPNEQGLYQDARAAVDYLSKKSVNHRCIILYGESLGTGAATQMAIEYEIGGLILQSPYTSLSEMRRYHYPWLPISPWDKFDSLSKIEKINTALLIIHGKRDTIVPFQQGHTLYKAAKDPKLMIVYPTLGHNNLINRNMFERILKFTRKQCVKN